jgi:hypothetical protein
MPPPCRRQHHVRGPQVGVPPLRPLPRLRHGRPGAPEQHARGAAPPRPQAVSHTPSAPMAAWRTLKATPKPLRGSREAPPVAIVDRLASHPVWYDAPQALPLLPSSPLQAVPVGRYLHGVLGRAHLHQPVQEDRAPVRPRPSGGRRRAHQSSISRRLARTVTPTPRGARGYGPRPPPRLLHRTPRFQVRGARSGRRGFWVEGGSGSGKDVSAHGPE